MLKARPRWLTGGAGVLTLLLSVSCGGHGSLTNKFTPNPGPPEGGVLGGGGDAGPDGTVPVLTGDGGGGDGGFGDASAGCPESATLVYVTGVGSQLWSFYPPTLKFTLIGTLSCLSSPTHMTVDRQANAWVVSSGMIYKASTANAACSAVPTWTPNFGDFTDFALTFVGTTNTVDNTLYLMGNSLGKFNIATGALTTIAAAPDPNPIGDMTSNGDGTLFFLLDHTNVTLFDLSPANGSVISQAPIAATGGGAQALAFWGGSFYAFENNIIYQYDPIKKTTKSLGMAPLQVTGAGQSTCVPKVPPPPK